MTNLVQNIMKKLFAFLMILSSVMFIVTSCDSTPDSADDFLEEQVSSKVTKPTFDMYLTTTTMTDFTFSMRFNNGGDDIRNMNCTIYWRRYASKPSSTPLKSDMTNVETMKIVNHNSKRTTFKKAHTGANEGNYIYYYTICSNSMGQVETPLTHCVIKR